MALAGEAGELCEIFQWMGSDDSFAVQPGHEKHSELSDELADILYYTIRIADLTGIDLQEAFWKKMKANEKKYPVDLARGNSKKYTEF
jgi:NTP pyrophosphatase (non-canonical NTP hydrolase)